MSKSVLLWRNCKLQKCLSCLSKSVYYDVIVSYKTLSKSVYYDVIVSYKSLSKSVYYDVIVSYKTFV